jgi:signal transduction histidine kinase
VQRVIDEVRAAHGGRAISLTVSGDMTGAWDGDRVAQAIGNLVLNAVEHTSGEVGVEARGDEAGVAVVVRNAGTFPERLRPSLFMPFRKGDRSGRGLGLGLFIVREVLNAHGGRIALESDERHTRFVTWWPRRAAGESAKTAFNWQ